jgi:hypothetical protein
MTKSIHPTLIDLLNRHALDPLGHRAQLAEEAFNLGLEAGRREARDERGKDGSDE